MNTGKKYRRHETTPMSSLKMSTMDYCKDFSDVMTTRSMSTSTPMATRTLSLSACSPSSDYDDSGYHESIVGSRLYDAAYLDATTMTPTCLVSTDCDMDEKVFDGHLLCTLCDERKCVCALHLETMDWEAPHDDDSIHKKPPTCPKKSDSDYHSLEFESSDLDSSFGASALMDKMDSFVINDVLRQFSPREPDRLIGRKIGLERVDIVSELRARNISAVSVILSYLEPVDLCRMQVCRLWKSMITEDVRASSRKRKYLKIRKLKASSAGKENLGKMMTKRQLRSLTPGNILTTVQPTCIPRSSVETPVANLFAEAVSTLRSDEMLRHCPNCHSPAKMYAVYDRGVCLSDKCKFDFCVKCFCDYHGARNCIPVTTKKPKSDSVGSKRSKKNLHRL